MAIRQINNIVDLMRFIVRKEKGIYVSIEEATATLDSTQLDYFEKLFADFEKNETIHDGLRPFRVIQGFTSSLSGFLNAVYFPDDYMHFTGNAVTIYGSTLYKIKFVNDDEWADATRSQLRQPLSTAAIAKDIGKSNVSLNGGFQLFPLQTLVGSYDYLRRPVTPVYAYTVSGRTITYNAGASVQLEWTDNYINPIMFAALSYWSIDMDDNGLIQYSEMQKAELDAGN